MSENNFLKQKFEGFSSPAAPEVWANIDAALQQKKTKRRFLWMCWSSAAIVVLGIGTTVFYVQQNTSLQTTEAIISESDDKEGNLTKEANTIKQDEVGKVDKENQNAQRSDQTEKDVTNNALHHIGDFNAASTKPHKKPMAVVNNHERISANESSLPVKTSFPKPDQYDPNKLQSYHEKDEDDQLTKMEIRNIKSINLSKFINQELAHQIESKPEPVVSVSVAPKRWEIQFIAGAGRGREIDVMPHGESDFLSANPSVTLNISSFNYTSNSPIAIDQVEIGRPLLGFASMRVSRLGQKRFQYTSGLSYQRYALKFKDTRQMNLGAHGLELPLLIEYRIIDKSKYTWSIGSGIATSFSWYNKSNVQVLQFRGNMLLQSNFQYHLKNDYSLMLGVQGNKLLWNNQNSLSNPIYMGFQVGATKKF